MPGQENICLHDYYYSLEIAELFEGKLKGKIVHFSNKKSFRLNCRRSTILDITNASHFWLWRIIAYRQFT
jgi:hypothetical protein